MWKSFAALAREAIVPGSSNLVLDDVRELVLEHLLNGRFLLDNGQFGV